MTTAVEYHSIVLDEKGRPIIAGTRYKVMQLVQDHTAWGLNPEQMVWQHPGLTLAQAYAAVTYYYEHKEEVDAKLQEWQDEYERLWAESQDSPIRQKLRAKGLIP